MSLSVKSINADSSFLLSFTPPAVADSKSDPQPYHILIDPWLVGASTVLSRRFAHTTHTAPACVDSLDELPTPDLVIVSQDMPDHCHRETLTQLPASTNATIVAPLAAAKRIQSWRHFNTSSVRPLVRYDSKKSDSVLHLPVWSETDGKAGEVTIAYIARRFDPSGIHNAIGLTFRPPGCDFEKTFSILYSPHGVDCKYALSYATGHLAPRGALPLDILLHSTDKVSAPWYFGGVICAGSPGGITLASNLKAKHWIAAHDEEKMTTGITSRSLKVEKHDNASLVTKLQEELVLATLASGYEKVSCTPTLVHTLDAGEDVVLAVD